MFKYFFLYFIANFINRNVTTQLFHSTDMKRNLQKQERCVGERSLYVKHGSLLKIYAIGSIHDN